MSMPPNTAQMSLIQKLLLLYRKPMQAYIERAQLPKVSFTYRGTKFEMQSVVVPTITVTLPSYVQPRKPLTESQPDAH